MSQYSISEISELTGITAHTLRKWELRHGLLAPKRTSTNIRYYTDDDLRKLLKVKLLLSQGGKISKLSRHSPEELNNRIEEKMVLPGQTTAFAQVRSNELMLSAMEFDSVSFESAWIKCVRHLGVPLTMTEVIYPLLNRVGIFWATEKLNPAQEHFLSCLIRQKLLSATDQVKPKEASPSRWILFLHDEEDHEIPLLFSQYLLLSNNVEVVYLGARVPFENLRQAMESTKPTHMLSFLTTNRFREALFEYLKRLSKQFPKQKILVGGGNSQLREMKPMHNITLLTAPNHLLEVIGKAVSV